MVVLELGCGVGNSIWNGQAREVKACTYRGVDQTTDDVRAILRDGQNLAW